MSEVEAEGVVLTLQDTRIWGGPKQAERQPRTVHEAFAQQFGVALVDDEEEPS